MSDLESHPERQIASGGTTTDDNNTEDRSANAGRAIYVYDILYDESLLEFLDD